MSTDLSVTDIVGLAQAMKGMDTSSDLYTGTMPTTSQYINDLWYEVIDDEEWWAMMDRVDQGLPPTEETEVDETTGQLMSNAGSADGQTTSSESGESKPSENMTSSLQISVLNGTSVEGLAQSCAQTIEDAGFKVSDYSNADSQAYDQTVVVYMDYAYEEQAEEIAAALGNATAIPNDGSYISDDDILVVVGADQAY